MVKHLWQLQIVNALRVMAIINHTQPIPMAHQWRIACPIITAVEFTFNLMMHKDGKNKYPQVSAAKNHAVINIVYNGLQFFFFCVELKLIKKIIQCLFVF
ncbi:MAG: hypothetical protein IPI66_07865 [Chitinophagaceae bacterium]|nr:hypothetical protein [Chitinophagaceae bacterium]